MEKIVEICTGSYLDALNAYKGGAKRIELNSALALGGLTPSLSSLILTKENTDLKVICMIRNRAGGFCYDEEEFKQMLLDAKLLLQNGADGLAYGFLNKDKTIDLYKTDIMTKLVKEFNSEAIFHRAFDITPNPYRTIDDLIDLKIDRILTSGQKAKAIDGLDLIKDLQSKYGDKIEILAGSGVNSTNASYIMNYAGISQVHSSCKNYLNDPTTIGKEVNYSYLQSPNEDKYDIVDQNLVKKLINSI